MAEEVRAGLLATPRSIPSKYFYDDRGSQLFEAITRLPEYYLTRTEESLLEAHADALIARLRPREIVELGSGAGRKIRLLLEAQRRAGGLGRLVLFDINPGVLEASAARLASDFPGLAIECVVGDFTSGLERLGPGGGRLMLFLASTIGNIHPDEVPDFLAQNVGLIPAALETLRYVDCALLARRISAECLLSTGLMDGICPPSTVFAAYNEIAAAKDIAVHPYSGHAVPPAHHENQIRHLRRRLAPG